MREQPGVFLRRKSRENHPRRVVWCCATNACNTERREIGGI
jgi:hypothetical protein